MIKDVTFSLYHLFVDVGIWPVVVRCIIGALICFFFAGLIAALWYYCERDPQE